MRSEVWKGVGVAIVACLVGGASAQQAGPLAGLDELLGKQKNLTIFHSYLKRYPQILSGVKAGEGVTIIAPDNVAMEKIPSSILKQPFEVNDTSAIVNALQYHVIKGTTPVASLKVGILESWETLSTDTKYTTVAGGQRVTTYKTADDIVTFITGLGTRSTLLTPGLTFAGGIVHTIDSPMIPPQELIATTSQYNLTGLQGGLFAADKVKALTEAKGITIFAPRNEAFQALGSTASTLTVEQVSSILGYHVLTNETIYSTSLRNGSTLTTSTGEKLKVLEFGNKLFINTAQITEKDILLKNGVIHTIDTVLNPAEKDDVPNPEVPTQSAIWPSATNTGFVPFTTAIPCSTSCSTSLRPGATGPGGQGGNGGNGLRTTSSRAAAAARAMETGFAGRAMGVAAAVVGGAALML